VTSVESKPAPSPPERSKRATDDLIEDAYAFGVPRDYGKVRHLRRIREPRQLAFIGYDTHHRAQWLIPRAAHAWLRLHDAAENNGIELQIVSAFRTVEYQLGILKRKIEREQSIDEILRISAAPGYSEHHSGRALDVTTPGYTALEEVFEQSPAFGWLSANAKRFGFRMSYPRGNPHGISYEPWHWCWTAARHS
jgi:zinc D-Ala-D-Ala carboxypeptidase